MTATDKISLHAQCVQMVAQRIATAKEAMDAAQAAANAEGKSSAGDKYETGRAMMQLERDQHARLLAEALKLRQALDALDPHKTYDNIQAGCLAITTAGNYYISVSLGRLTLNQAVVMAISPATPLAANLLGLKTGESATFNGKKITIEQLL